MESLVYNDMHQLQKEHEHLGPAQVLIRVVELKIENYSSRGIYSLSQVITSLHQ